MKFYWERKTLKVSLSFVQDYGVMLRAEPDHKTLGFRLKGAFKDVTKEIKGLTDDHLTEFVKSGKMTLLGHDIGPEDVRIMYTFDATKVSKKITEIAIMRQHILSQLLLFASALFFLC